MKRALIISFYLVFFSFDTQAGDIAKLAEELINILNDTKITVEEKADMLAPIFEKMDNNIDKIATLCEEYIPGVTAAVCSTIIVSTILCIFKPQIQRMCKSIYHCCLPTPAYEKIDPENLTEAQLID